MSDECSRATARPALAVSTDGLRRSVAAARAQGRTIGLVPTMGALHEGHFSLVRASQKDCDFTIVSIFVNPAQFGPHEDLQSYPRMLEKDLEALAACKADLVFAPSSEEMYPAGFSTYVEPPAVARSLEGRCRPGHFRGVATVVLKLFLLTGADAAFFGAKDYQQSLVIRRMAEDFNVPIRIHVCPTVREPDGLAISSRNRYLSQDQRKQAAALSRSLELAADLASRGERDPAVVIRQMRRVLDSSGITRVDYIALVHPETLEDVSQINGPTIAAMAAYVGNARLIDNRYIG